MYKQLCFDQIFSFPTFITSLWVECASHFNFGLEFHCWSHVRQCFPRAVLIIFNFSIINSVLANVFFTGVDLNAHVIHPFSVLILSPPPLFHVEVI